MHAACAALGSNARIEKIGTPERVINAFGPEVIGQNVEGKVMDMEVVDREGLKYYKYELEPHYLVSITAKGNRLYLIALSANGEGARSSAPGTAAWCSINNSFLLMASSTWQLQHLVGPRLALLPEDLFLGKKLSPRVLLQAHHWGLRTSCCKWLT